MLKPSCWCMQSFLLPYPFPWCPFSIQREFFCCIHPFLWISAQLPWMVGCGTVSQCCDVQTLLCVSRESWGGTLRGSFTFQDFPGCQFDHFFALNFPLQLHLVLPSYEALVLGLDSSSPSFSMAFKGRKNPHNAYFISRYRRSSALLGSLLCPGLPNHDGGWAALGLKPCLAMKCILKPLLWMPQAHQPAISRALLCLPRPKMSAGRIWH